MNKNQPLAPYLIGITKNIIKNKYRHIHFNYNIDDYTENLKSPININLLIEQNEKNRIIENSLNKMNTTDKNMFIMPFILCSF